ncbi:hypothetical protein WA026_022265 [Henosepilachna vigintioctopunctata]|uniref:Uncharacterized protein n=1 Tax=Henosepilachna vigintioctopunctata TaxID=420089 RepID=A0AAW1UN84_9CUCU
MKMIVDDRRDSVIRKREGKMTYQDEDVKSGSSLKPTAQDGEETTVSCQDDYCNVKYHVEIIKTTTFTEKKQVKKALKKRNQRRNVWVSLTEELKNTYYDDRNLQFDDEYLEEITHMKENEVRFCNILFEKRLLLQVRKTIDNGTLIDLIASGFSNHIMDEIDREKLTKTEDLHNELGKVDHLTYKKNFVLKNNKPNTRDKIEKVPCKICREKIKEYVSILCLSDGSKIKEIKIRDWNK